MDRTVEYARRKRQALIEELRKIETFLNLYDELTDKNDREDTQEPSVNIQAASEEVAAVAQQVLPLMGAAAHAEATQPRKRAAGNPPSAELIRAAREAMLAKGHPLTRRQVLEALEARGMTINGHDKIKVVGTALWRSKAFTQLDGYGYWPKDAPTPLRREPLELRGA